MIFSTKYTTAIFIIPLKNNDRTIQDGSGVGRSYTHLLQGPNQNYNQITQQSTWRTNWRLTEQKSYNQGLTEETTWRLVGRAVTRQGLAPHSREAAENLKAYLSCKGSPWEASVLSPTLGSPAQSTRHGSRSPYNICLWKSAGILSTREKQESTRNQHQKKITVHSK